MTSYADVLERMSTTPAFADSDAWSLLDCAEDAEAATEMAEHVAMNRIHLSPDEKAAILEGLREFTHGDREYFESFARMLEPENWDELDRRYRDHLRRMRDAGVK